MRGHRYYMIRMRRWLAPFLLVLMAFIAETRAAEFYVAPTGNDMASGSLEAPWRSIQKAADSLEPGDTAWVREGVYKERVTVQVSGAAPDRFVTLRAFPGERPIIDGSGLTPPANRDTALVLVQDQSFVRVEGFEIRRYRARSGNRVPCGILVIGECDHIEIRGNDVHHIAYHTRSGNAFGIAVYGTSAVKPITRVIIDDNDVHHCKLGNSESLTINGNVTNFEVTNNRVHDNSNIGIVFIGFERSCPDPAQDQARDGICRGNVVWNISSFGNPAYGREYSAGGIYVDGGTRILIERNISHDNDIGLELASEHKGRATSAITARENLFYRNRIGGLFLGGYDRRRGGAEQCVIRHNTFFENDTRRDGNGELFIHHYAVENAITHNIFSAGRQSLLLGNPSNTGAGNVLDYNLYFAPAGALESAWQWQKRKAIGLDEFRKLSGQDTHSFFGDPEFSDPAALDLRTKAGSAAIDAGDPEFVAAPSEVDIEGEARLAGSAVDIGAHEFQALRVISPAASYSRR